MARTTRVGRYDNPYAVAEWNRPLPAGTACEPLILETADRAIANGWLYARGGETTAVLLVLGQPFLHIDIALPDDRVLPKEAVSRQVHDVIRQEFGSQEAERQFAALLRVSDPLMSRDALRQLPKDPARALPLIEHFLLYGDQVAIIINFLDTIIPAGDVSYMSGDDRTNLVAFQRWITSSRLLKKDNIVVLIAESVAEAASAAGGQMARRVQ